MANKVGEVVLEIGHQGVHFNGVVSRGLAEGLSSLENNKRMFKK